MKRRFSVFFVTIIISVFMISTFAFAEGQTRIIETQTAGDQIIIYVSGVNPYSSNVEYQIGTDTCAAFATGEPENIYTVILWDNSKSVMSKNDKNVRELLKQIVRNQAYGEQFAIYSLGNNPELITRGGFTSDTGELERIIDGTRVENKDALVIANLYDIVKEINNGGSEDFYRIIVISDGDDSSAAEASKEELDELLDVHRYPVYMINVNGSKEEALRNLYSISRRTGAQYFSLAGNMAEITSVLSADTVVGRFVCEVPMELRNGSKVNTRLTVDGKSFEAQVQMPWAEYAKTADDTSDEIEADDAEGYESDDIPVQEVEEETFEDEDSEDEDMSEDEEEPSDDDIKSSDKHSDGFFDKLIDKLTLTGLVIICTVFVVLLAAVTIIIMLSNAKKRKALSDDENRIQMYDRLDMEIGNGWKNQASSESADYYRPDNDDGTLVLFDQPPRGMRYGTVVLSNIDQPGITYQAPLAGVISIGREYGNTITIENDRSVSKRHCEIFEMDGEVYIKDCGSSNGTFIGPKDVNPRMTGPERLVNNATVTIGHCLYSVTLM